MKKWSLFSPQTLKKIKRYVEDQNQTVYVPRGLMVIDPVERGLRTVSFILWNQLWW